MPSPCAQSIANRLIALCLTVVFIQGCASIPRTGVEDRQAQLEAALSSIHLSQRMHRVEEQIIERVDASPLDLGPLGSALLELDEHSLVGHYALRVFYDAVGEPESARNHATWGKEIVEGIIKVGSSFVVGSPAQAIAYLETLGYRCIGTSYALLPESPLGFQILTVDQNGVNKGFDFVLSHAKFLALDGIETDFNRFEDLTMLMSQRARAGDTAARSLIAGFYMNDAAQLENWLEDLGRGRPNAMIDLMRGALQQNLAVDQSGELRMQAIEEAERHYLRAVQAGSTEAMRLLGRLYRSPELGPEHETDAVKLYLAAAEAKHLAAIRDLSFFFERGDSLFAQDLEEARTHYRNAFLWGDKGDLRRYADFLRRNEGSVGFDQEVLDALQQGSSVEDTWSLITLGNLYADGVGVVTDYRRARNLFRKAARKAPEVPDVVNEVAWILSTSNRRDLRDNRFARKIMDHMMSSDEEARKSPMYLDTWAATYAALGNFERAVELQRQAIEAAKGYSASEDAQKRLDEELATHLQSFTKGEALSLDLFDEDE